MKILIFTKNWLGDILFEVPAIRAIRENFPEAKITALAPERCREILEALPYLDKFRPFDERTSERSFLSKLRFVSWLRNEKFDQVFLFHRSLTRTFLAWLGGIPKRIGYWTRKRARLLTVAASQPSRPVHQVDYFLVLLKWAGLRVKFGAEYLFFFQPEDEEKARHLSENHGLHGKNFVAFHIGANWEPKRWPAGHFVKLADLISENFKCPVILTGSADDEILAQEIMNQTKSTRPISLCGKTSLRVLGAFFQKAAFVVSSDSGPLHIASGVGTPVVALFGPTCPRLTGPRGSGKKMVIQFVPQGYSIPWVGEKLPPGGWMENISPEAVLERIQKENLWMKPNEKISSLSH